MAKKDSGFDAFLAEVVAALPEGEKRTTFEEAIKNDTVQSKLREGFLARSDYSRSMDALRAEREEFDSVVTETNERIAGWQQWYEEAKAEVAGSKKGADDDALDLGPTPPGVTPEQLAKILADRDKMAIKFASVLTDLQYDYRSKFGEKLDSDALIAYATRRGVPIDVAYNELTAPKERERAEKDVEARIKAARDEAVKEFASANKLPTASRPSEPHPLDLAVKAPQGATERVAAAVTAFNAGGGGNS
jgi:hypothetical protein